MKVCILSAVNIRHMSMVSIYTEWLKNKNIEFDIIYMDKYDEVEETFGAAHVYRYVNKINQKSNNIYKALKYFKFRFYALNILKQNKYNFIIVWNDVAIYLLGDVLGRKYKNQYCLNIRDTNGKIIFYPQKWFIRCFINASFCTVSSDEYIPLLPKRSYIHIHSLNQSILKDIEPRHRFQNENEPIRIGFIGYVRFLDINRNLLDVFANDNRFVLQYFGTHADDLKKYANDNSIKNVEFHDTFPVSQTAIFLSKIDIMNNLYGNENANLKTALSIKLYNALWSRIPILVSPDTYMEKLTKKLGIGFTVTKIDQNIKDEIYHWYRNLDFKKLDYTVSVYINDILKQHEEFENILYESMRINNN